MSGGPKDINPPRMIKEKSDSNFQTQHDPKSITLSFDEWIEIKNSSQILVSPPLEFRPQINTKGKSVVVTFDKSEVLRDSTTYSVNFGNAICDFNESNPVENFQFVFSTGDKIDSLELSGRVIDAFSKKPVEKVAVMLYIEDRDSIVYESQPYYYSVTNKSGDFNIRYLRAGKYKCFALKDSDFNFLYNQDSEEIGFLDSLVAVQNDSLEQKLTIELFLPVPKTKIEEFDLSIKGKLKLKTNNVVDSFIIIQSNKDFLAKEIFQDSIILWYLSDSLSQDSINIDYSLNEIRDTLVIKSKASAGIPGSLGFQSFKQRKKSILDTDTLLIEFSQIISEADTSFIKLSEVKKGPPKNDSLQIDTIPVFLDYDLIIDSLDKRILRVFRSWEIGKNYDLVFYPQGIKGFYNNTNDTISTVISVLDREDFGNILCRFDSLNGEKNYLVFLKSKKNIIQKKTIVKSTQAELNFENIEPGKYFLEIIEDLNANGRWDPGNYVKGYQSEKKLEIQLEELRKNWDIESDIKWDSQ